MLAGGASGAAQRVEWKESNLYTVLTVMFQNYSEHKK